MKVVNWNTKEEKEVDTKIYSNDMDVMCECPECEKKLRFGQLYNTGDWYESQGIWLVGVCKECAEKHWKERERESRKNG